MKVPQLLGLLQKILQENGDCEVHAGLASALHEFKVVDVAHLEHAPSAGELSQPHSLRRPRVVLPLDLP